MMYILILIVSSSRELYFVVTGKNASQVTTEALCRDRQLLTFKQARIHCVQMFAFSPLLKIFHFHKMMYDRCSWNSSLMADEVMNVLTFLVSQGWDSAIYTYVSLSRIRVFIYIQVFCAEKVFPPRFSPSFSHFVCSLYDQEESGDSEWLIDRVARR